MHKLRALIKQIEATHKGLGALVAVNILAAKAKICILNVAPAGCGKSAATDIVHKMLGDQTKLYTSVTLAGLVHLRKDLTESNYHIIIDDLGAEKSQWSKVSTITVLATLVHTHNIHKITQGYEIKISNFQGSASLNIQPVLMSGIVQEDDWVSVIRDKVLRYYHLIRPINPKKLLPNLEMEWGASIDDVKVPSETGKLWYQLLYIGLTQWSYARCKEHLPNLLRASAALDGRKKVNNTDYNLLIKLLLPMQLERYIITSYGFEEGRVFQNNTYCILVEIASHGAPTMETVAEDYKVSPSTTERLAVTAGEWCWVESTDKRRIKPTKEAEKILQLIGVGQKW